MTIRVPLPAQLEQFLQEQVATGRFQSPSDVVCAALRLLEQQSRSLNVRTALLKQEIDKGLASKPSEPVSNEFWNGLRGRMRAGAVPPPKQVFGLWKDREQDGLAYQRALRAEWGQ